MVTTFNSDSIAKKDLLNRKPLAEKLAHNILHSFPNESESIVIGITDKWGGGKSSFLGFIESHINSEKSDNDLETIFFRFNAWSYSGSSKLTTLFYTQLLSILGDKSEDIRKKVEQVYNTAKKASKNLPKNNWIDFFKNGAQKYIEASIKKPTHEELRSKIQDFLSTEKVQLVIAIDEIDRLGPEEVIEILKIVKSNCNYLNTVYLLCFDKAQVNNLLKDKYQSFGNKYLEKFIQIEYPLPQVTSNQLFDSLKAELVQFQEMYSIPFDFEYLRNFWFYHGLKDQITNIRDIKRIINSLKLRLTVIKNNVNPNDFLAIETIRLTSFKNYNSIYEGIRSEVLPEYFSEQTESSWESNLNNASLAKIVRYLRDQLPTYAFSTESKKHLFERHYFERYFTLKVKRGEIEETQLGAFLNSNYNTQIKHLSYFHENNQLKNLFIRLGNPQLEIDPKIINISFIKLLLSIDRYASFNYKDHEYYTSAIINLLKIFDKESIPYDYKLLMSFYKNDKISKGTFFFIDEIIYQHEKKGFSILQQESHPDFVFHEKINPQFTDIKNSYQTFIEKATQEIFNAESLDIEEMNITFLKWFLARSVEFNPGGYNSGVKNIISVKGFFHPFAVFLIEHVIVWWDNNDIDRLQEGYKDYLCDMSEIFVSALKQRNESKYSSDQNEKVLNFIKFYEENTEKFKSKLT